LLDGENRDRIRPEESIKGRLTTLIKNTFIMPEGYCVKCKQKQEISGAKEVSMKGKGGVERKAMTGTCPKCGTKMFRIMGKA